MSDHPLLRDMLHVWLRMAREHKQRLSLFALNRDDGSQARLAAELAVDALVPLWGRSTADAARAIREAEVRCMVRGTGRCLSLCG